MDAEAFRKAGHELIDFIADYRARVETLPVQCPHPPNHLRAQLPAAAPEEGEPWERIRADVETLILPHLFNWQSPNFFGFFPANASFPSILGELLSAGFAQQGMLWVTSPACTELEIVTLDWLAKILALPDHFLSTSAGGGVIQGTASEAIIVLMVAARSRLLGKLGLSVGDASPRLIAYASESTHSCVAKAAAVLGLRARILAVDKEQRLRPDALEAAIAEDKKAGLLPFFCCATVGTTSTAAADPLVPIGRICNASDVWFHIDAAYAGAACIVPELRGHLEGVELADSFNFNPHKFLLVNFDLSALWIRDRAALISALSITPAYLRNAASDAGAVDFRDWQLPLGRRFRALKLWFVLRTYGIAGLRTHIRKHMTLSGRLEAWLRNDSRFEVMYPRNFTLVTFRVKGCNDAFQKAYKDAINDSGRAFISHTLVHDQYILRASVGTESTEERHVDALCQLLNDTYVKMAAQAAASPQYAEERKVAIKAVQLAAKITASVQEQLISADTVLKKDRSPVTVADLCAQAIVIKELQAAFPRDHIVAEESGKTLNKNPELKEKVVKILKSVLGDLSEAEVVALIDRGAQHKPDNAHRWWTLDPVDGTLGFLRKEQYAIALALMANDIPVVGVLGCPNLPLRLSDPNSPRGCVQVAVRGQGAFQAPLTDIANEVRIHCSNETDAARVVHTTSVESGHSFADVTGLITKAMGVVQEPVKLDSQCKYAVVARGDASVYLRLSDLTYRENIWDHAAGVVIVEEAGGKVSDMNCKALDFSKGRTLMDNLGVVCAANSVYDTVHRAVQQANPVGELTKRADVKKEEQKH